MVKELEAMQAALTALESLEPEARERAIFWIASALEVDFQQPGSKADEIPQDGERKELSAKDFLAQKKPETDVERIAVLAYYLTKVRDQQTFKTADLTKLNVEAAGRRIANPASASRNALQQNNYLASAAGGRRQITALGEEIVEALPDRDAVKAVRDAAPKSRRRKAKRNVTTGATSTSAS